MDNNSNISPKWARFRKLWIIVAIILFLLLLLLLLAGYSPWGKKCEVEPTVVEKVVEKEKLVDNPEHLARIGVLEKENALIASLKAENSQIAGLKTNIVDLTKSAGLVSGLQAKVKALEGIDLNFESPKLMSKINLLETENATIGGFKQRILELEATNAKTNDDRNAALTKQIADLNVENGLISGLQAKVKALEAIDINFIKPEDNTELLQKINGLEVENLKINALQGRIEDSQVTIDGLKAKIGIIPGLQAKVKALEAIDINFIKAEDNSALMQKINNLEIQTLKIPSLESRIGELKTENSLIPGLKAKVKALEAIDINFINNAAPASSPAMKMPGVARLYFESGSSRFPTDVKQSMADVMVFLRANPDASVSLAGFHDEVGNADWNRRLAAKRSNRVKQILLDAGISENRIKVMRPSQTLGTGSPEEARRVEVLVFN